jgi:hypothetical protein
MANFRTALNHTLGEMLHTPANYDAFCCAVYWDDNCEDNAIVMFMEYSAYGNIHAVMKDLHSRLSEKMGYPVCLCHNHPTDESILIHGGSDDASVFYADHCCKEDTIRCCLDIIDDKSEGYRDEIRSIAAAAVCLSEGLNKSPQYVLECLDWNKDPQAQLIRLLIDYHN